MKFFPRLLGIFVTVTCLGLMFPEIANAQSAQTEAGSSEGDTFWEAIRDDATSEQIMEFLLAFPKSRYAPDARAMLKEREASLRLRLEEEAVFSMAGMVVYDQPLRFGSFAIIGKTIPEILKLSPEYPPVEGLPEKFWKKNDCSSCHTWSRENLCTQAKTYAKRPPQFYHQKPHPFGGKFKISLRNWAENDCQ